MTVSVTVLLLLFLVLPGVSLACAACAACSACIAALARRAAPPQNYRELSYQARRRRRRWGKPGGDPSVGFTKRAPNGPGPPETEARQQAQHEQLIGAEAVRLEMQRSGHQANPCGLIPPSAPLAGRQTQAG